MIAKPRGLQSVYAMARPRRPAAERAAVIAAAGRQGSAAQRAARLAETVARAALADIDGDPADRVIAALRSIEPTPVDILATDAEIDTASLIVAERVRRMQCRGGRRLAERAWPADDDETVRAVAETLARRYRKQLAKTG